VLGEVPSEENRVIFIVCGIIEFPFNARRRHMPLVLEKKFNQRELRPAEEIEGKMNCLIEQCLEFVLVELVIGHQEQVFLMLQADYFGNRVREFLGPGFKPSLILQRAFDLCLEIRFDRGMNPRVKDVHERDRVRLADRARSNHVSDLFYFSLKDVSHTRRISLA